MGYPLPHWDLAGGVGTLVYPLPPVNRQTPVKTVPYRRTTYAVGKKSCENRFLHFLDAMHRRCFNFCFSVCKFFITELRSRLAKSAASMERIKTGYNFALNERSYLYKTS